MIKTKKETLKAPIAEKIPFKSIVHGYKRVDNYHWMRLTDEQKSSKNPDK